VQLNRFGGSHSTTLPLMCNVPSGCRMRNWPPGFGSISTESPANHCRTKSVDVSAVHTFSGVEAI
jgi:hypothetical protein